MSIWNIHTIIFKSPRNVESVWKQNETKIYGSLFDFSKSKIAWQNLKLAVFGSTL